MSIYSYGEEDINHDINQLIHVFACGDGGPALIRFKLQMIRIAKQLEEDPGHGPSETLIELFRKFVKLSEVIGGKQDE